MSVTSDEQPAEGMMCVLMSGQDMIGCCMTDSAGQATIQITGGFSGEEAELVVSGSQCLPHHFPLDVQVGIGQFIHEKDINATLYPNPAESYIRVNLYSERKEIVNICLNNAIGQKVWEKKNIGFDRQVSLIVELEKFPAGIYFLNIENMNGINYNRKIIKK